MKAGRYEERAASLGVILDAKNVAYGNSWANSAKILEVLWPDGIPVASYCDASVFIRMLDKMQRIATGDVTEDARLDLAGYAVLLWADKDA